MKYAYRIFFICIIFLYSSYSIAQRSTFSLGVKGGIGLSVPNPNSSIDIQGQSYSLRTNAYYKGGMTLQYILGDIVGIDAAILNTNMSCSAKDHKTSSLQQSLGWTNNIGLNSFQVPFQLMYLIRLRANPNMRLKLTGGIAMDWLLSRISYVQQNPLFISSLLCGVRIKSRSGKYGHIEYGLEYQHSLHGKYDIDIQSYLGTGIVHSRYSILSFSLYYFFLNRGH